MKTSKELLDICLQHEDFQYNAIKEMYDHIDQLLTANQMIIFDNPIRLNVTKDDSFKEIAKDKIGQLTAHINDTWNSRPLLFNISSFHIFLHMLSSIEKGEYKVVNYNPIKNLNNWKAFVEFSILDYMDSRPRKEIIAMTVGKDIDEYVKHMNKTWSGGTTTFIKVLSKQEARDYSDDIIKREIAHPQADSKELIEKVSKLYIDTYLNNNI